MAKKKWPDMPRAGDLHDERQKALPGWLDVTADNYPTVHSAFEAISHDMGEGAGHAAYSVAPEFVALLENVERGLRTLSTDALQEFAIGDLAEHNRMVREFPDALTAASKLLNGFFNDWEED